MLWGLFILHWLHCVRCAKFTFLHVTSGQGQSPTVDLNLVFVAVGRAVIGVELVLVAFVCGRLMLLCSGVVLGGFIICVGEWLLFRGGVQAVV